MPAHRVKGALAGGSNAPALVGTGRASIDQRQGGLGWWQQYAADRRAAQRLRAITTAVELGSSRAITTAVELGLEEPVPRNGERGAQAGAQFRGCAGNGGDDGL